MVKKFPFDGKWRLLLIRHAMYIFLHRCRIHLYAMLNLNTYNSECYILLVKGVQLPNAESHYSMCALAVKKINNILASKPTLPFPTLQLFTFAIVSVS